MVRFLFVFTLPSGLRSSLTVDCLRSGDWNRDYAQATSEAMAYGDCIDATPTMLDWCYVTDGYCRIERIDDESVIPFAVAVTDEF